MEKSFAEKLVEAYGEAVVTWHSQENIESRDALAVLKKSRADLIQALTVPAPVVEEDFPTVRDEFAKAALTGFMSQEDNRTVSGTPKEIEAKQAGLIASDAAMCYRYADAMMAARKGGA